MRLSRQCEAAIGLLVFCAMHPGRVTRTEDAAAFAKTTTFNAQQLVSQLVRKGLLEGRRGKYGGICLGRRADRIGVGEVVRLMDPWFAPEKALARHQAFNELLQQASRAAFGMFDSVTIADLAARSPDDIPDGRRLARKKRPSPSAPAPSPPGATRAVARVEA